MVELRPSRGHAPRIPGGRPWPARRFTLAVVAALPVIMVASCSTLGPDTTAAAGVAVAFHRAIQDRDGSTACGLLGPATKEDLEGSSGQGCPEAILAQDLPEAQDVQDSQAFGRAAQVLMAGDVVFLSCSGTGG